MNKPKNKQSSNQESQNKDLRSCDCNADPIAILPPELRPKQKSWKSGLRKVTCRGCGLIYWTNRETDYCQKCKAEGLEEQADSV
jgi:hypothetical protein